MFNVCPHCGLNRPDKTIDPEGPYAVCPECGHKHRFLFHPLVLVGGASCSGKTTVLRSLMETMTGIVLLDADILWRPEFDTPGTGHRDFFETWLRLCKNIGQSGRPVVLFGGGFAVPHNIEPCVESRYFSKISYLALTCDDPVLTERMKQRPAWRGSRDPKNIEAHIAFNSWIKENAVKNPAFIGLIDTSTEPVPKTAARIASIIRTVL